MKPEEGRGAGNEGFFERATDGIDGGIQSYEKFRSQCVARALTAFQMPIQYKNITKKVFRQLFGFDRAETEEKQISNTSKFSSTYFKKMEQRVLRKFLSQCKCKISQSRKVMKDKMSLSVFKEQLLEKIQDDEIKKILSYMKDIESFLDPMIKKEYEKRENGNLEVLKNRLIVEGFIFFKIRKIVFDYHNQKEIEDQENVIQELQNLPKSNYGRQQQAGEFMERYWDSFNHHSQQFSLMIEDSPREEGSLQNSYMILDEQPRLMFNDFSSFNSYQNNELSDGIGCEDQRS